MNKKMNLIKKRLLNVCSKLIQSTPLIEFELIDLSCVSNSFIHSFNLSMCVLTSLLIVLIKHDCNYFELFFFIYFHSKIELYPIPLVFY